MIQPFQEFQATFAVPLTCESCVKDVSGSLYKLQGINNVEANLKNQLVLVEGTAAPSSIVSAIQQTGRDAILRGSGTSDNISDKIRGLARMVQVSSNMTIVDLTVKGVSPGKYWATIREAGDISEGAASTGGIWESLKQSVQGSATPRGVVGTVDVDKSGKGNVLFDKPVSVWEMIGRSMVLSKVREGPFQKQDPDTLVGVIARSAGVWDNDKIVCSCSGKNVWEERKEQVLHGMP
ncbi:copper chaperone [Arachnomyces sp. PD_36]|nr:copper chaperone [Arachnomyces sp. PD_36]